MSKALTAKAVEKRYYQRRIDALQVYVLSYAEYLRAVNDFNNQVSKLQSVSGVFQ